MIQQLFINSLIAGAMYALIGLGFSLIYRTEGFFNFAHGVIITAGAYFTYFFMSKFDIPLAAAIPISICWCVALGCFIEIGIFRPLRYKGASPLVLLIASLGTYVVLQNSISLLFGDDTKTIRYWKMEEGISMFGAIITPVQLIIVVVSSLVFVLCVFFVTYTKHGKTMRAVANDQELAFVSGINIDKIILISFALGSAIAGIAGILIAVDVDMSPGMGMNALLMGVVAVIIGGVNSIPGIILGALLLAMVQQFGAWFIGSQWQDSTVFIILVMFLLFKPEGFLGKKIKSATA